MGRGRWIAVGLVAAVLVWVGISGTLTVPELVAGLVASGVAVALAGFAARAMGAEFHPRPGWLRILAGLPSAVVSDTAALARLLPRLVRDREVGSDLVAVHREVPPERQKTDVTLLTFAATITPTTIVLGYDPQAAVTLVHALPRRDEVDAAIERWLP